MLLIILDYIGNFLKSEKLKRKKLCTPLFTG